MFERAKNEIACTHIQLNLSFYNFYTLYDTLQKELFIQIPSSFGVLGEDVNCFFPF